MGVTRGRRYGGGASPRLRSLGIEPGVYIALSEPPLTANSLVFSTD